MPDPSPTTPTTAMTKTGAAANFVWGLPNGVNITTYGRVQSFSDNRTSDKEPLPDGNGETDGVVYYNHRNEGTLEAIIPVSGLSSVEIAETVSITLPGDESATVYNIEGCQRNWTAGAWAKVTLTLVKYQMLTASSGTSTTSSSST